MTATDSTWIGLFDLFRIGVGPSSSHTVGPMLAAARFIAEVPTDLAVERLRVELFSSLALTGKGHATDTAVILGLLGHRPDILDLDRAATFVAGVAERKLIMLPGGRKATFDPTSDLLFRKRERLAFHPNALRFTASGSEREFSRVYYSVGGGFVVTGEEDELDPSDCLPVPYPFKTSEQLLAVADVALSCPASCPKPWGERCRTDSGARASAQRRSP